MHPNDNLPLTVNPQKALAFGVEKALLVELLEQFSVLTTDTSFAITTARIQQRCPFWTAAQIALYLEELQQAGVFSASSEGEMWQISFSYQLPAQNESVGTSARSESTERQPVLRPEPVAPSEKIQRPQRSKVPSFGGGYRRSASELDEIFAAAEAKKRQQIRMELNWQPTQAFFEQLQMHGIQNEFAQSCLPEFTLYYLDQSDSETTWNQKLLAWVRRAVRDEQSRTAKEQRLNNPSHSGGHNEKGRRDTRENRKRVTAAVMDLKNLDW
jgi:hypothetical protein